MNENTITPLNLLLVADGKCVNLLKKLTEGMVGVIVIKEFGHPYCLNLPSLELS